MKINEILEKIKELSTSQGFWGRLYATLMDIKNSDPEEWKSVVKRLEAERFDTTLDMVLYFEEGKYCHRKMWRVPVVWESYGIIEVPGDTLEEALDYFEKNMDQLPLPTEWSYIEGSFAPAIEDREGLEGLVAVLTRKGGDDQ